MIIVDILPLRLLFLFLHTQASSDIKQLSELETKHSHQYQDIFRIICQIEHWLMLQDMDFEAGLFFIHGKLIW